MGVILFDKRGNEVEITHPVDVPSALASGNYFEEDPTRRKKVNVPKPEEEKPKEERPKEEGTMREVNSAGEGEKEKTLSWRDEVSRKGKR